MHELTSILTVVSGRIPAVSLHPVHVDVGRARTLEHMVIVLVYFLPKVLQARVFLSGGTIVKAEVDLASLGEREAWRVLVSIHVILPGNIKSVYEAMLPRANLI